jgi:hypothetical protein
MNKELIAKWEARGGKRYLSLYRDKYGYCYQGEDCGGVLPPFAVDFAAVDYMEATAVKVLAYDFPSVKRIV